MKIANKNYNLQPQKTYSKFDNGSNGEHTGILFNNTERSTNSSSNIFIFYIELLQLIILVVYSYWQLVNRYQSQGL